MFNKRLISMVPQALRYILRNVAAQWTALVANVVLMLLIGLFLQRLFDGVAVDGWVVMLLGAGVAVIAVRMACLTYAQRMGVAAAAAAKRSVRRQVYDKLVRMGPGYSERIATSEAVQVSVEGCEQLESYFGQYLPQLLYAVLAPLTVFAFWPRCACPPPWPCWFACRLSPSPSWRCRRSPSASWAGIGAPIPILAARFSRTCKV